MGENENQINSELSEENTVSVFNIDSISDARQGDSHDSLASISKIKNWMSYKIHCDFEVGIKAYLKFQLQE